MRRNLKASKRLDMISAMDSLDDSSPSLNDEYRAVYAKVSNGDGNILISGSFIFEAAVKRCTERYPLPAILFIGPTNVVCDQNYKHFSGFSQSLGLKCITLVDEEQISEWDWDGSIVIAMPDLLDKITRKREVCDHVFAKVKLLCICDLQLVADSRVGCMFEALIARLSVAIPALRVVATSTPLLNPTLAKRWLSASYHDLTTVPDKQGVCTNRKVIRVPSREMNYFKFENALNARLPDLIAKYSKGKPTLVYCSTRKSVELAATFLYKILTPKSHFGHQLPSFTDPKLNELVPRGVAYHCAGMPFEDRRAIECLFRQGKLSVLCTTSLPNSSVKLSCQLAIVKGAKRYSDGGYVDYTARELEKLGTDGNTMCVVLADENSGIDLESSSSQLISRLPSHLDEYLLTELALGLIANRDSAINWFQRTLFSLQVKDADTIIDGSLQRLGKLGLVKTCGPRLQASPLACPASRYCVNLDSLHTISGSPSLEPPAALLKRICMAIPKEDCRIYQGDKGLFSRLASSGVLRYPLSNRQISEGWQKSFITIQVVLGKKDDLKTNFRFAQSSKIIMRRARQIISCMVRNMAHSKERHPVTLWNAIELAGAIQGECWHEGPGVLRQLDGIGAGYEGTLLKASLGTIESLRNADPSTIEFILKRNPPFGVQLREQMAKLPCLSLDVYEQVHKPDDQLRLTIRCRCEGVSMTKPAFLMAILHSMTDEASLALFTEIHQAIEFTEEVTILNWSDQKDLTISLLATSHAGLNIHKTFTANTHTNCDHIDAKPPKIGVPEDEKATGTSAIRTTVASSILTVPMLASESVANSGLHCAHRCKDKQQCKHLCCKGIIKRKRRSGGPKGCDAVALLEGRTEKRKGRKYRAQSLEDPRAPSECDYEYIVCDGASLVEAFLNYIQAFHCPGI